MIGIKSQQKPWKDEIGDILLGRELIHSQFMKSEFTDPINLMSFGCMGVSYNPFTVLDRIGVDGKFLSDTMQYRCPFDRGNVYYWFVPVFILCQNGVNAYRQYGFEEKIFDFAFDTDWTKRNYDEYDWDGDLIKVSPGSIICSMHGHGFTMGTIPSDGSKERRMVKVELTNGDFIAGYIWVWFNK